MTEIAKSNRSVGFLSLGCPKALVDSEQIITSLAATGIDVVDAEDEAEVVVINTCGFIDAAKEESFAAIETVLNQGREVVVTGCLGADKAALQSRFPALRFVSGPLDVAPVVNAVKEFIPEQLGRELPLRPKGLQPEARMRLTPPHYSYLKISEGCNHSCSFCIIPDMRGGLRSRNMTDILAEARIAVEQGSHELLVIAQDLSAYGVDQKYPLVEIGGNTVRSDLEQLCAALGDIAPWIRLHYVYPYPHVDRVIPLMAEGKILPYLDMPLQHASPRILKSMRRPAATEKALQRIQRWREQCPELSIRSTFIVGFPGETDEDVGQLLDFLDEAELDRAGCFTYSAVDGAAANKLPDHVDERDKLDRQEAVYELQAQISARRLKRHVGQTLRLLVDEIEPDGAIARTQFDAPDIDGVVHLPNTEELRVGEFCWAKITAHDDHDLFAEVAGTEVSLLS